MSENVFSISNTPAISGKQDMKIVEQGISDPNNKIDVPIGQQLQKGALPMPKKPVATKVKTVEVLYAQTLSDIAINAHVSVAEILSANPDIKSADRIEEGQKIKVPYIPDEIWDKYQADLAAYNTQEAKKAEEARKAEAAAALKEKIKIANEKIEKIRQQDYGKDYDLKVDTKTGNIILTLKTNKKLGEIRKEFRLPAGHLREMNPNIIKDYKPDKSIYDIDDGIRVLDWDSCEAKKGNHFVVNPTKVNPSKGFWSDLWDRIRN